MRVSTDRITPMLVVFAAAAAPAEANADVVGQWHFNEGGGTTAADTSGYGNNGTISGEVGWVQGRFGSAVKLDGNPGEVEVPNRPSLQPASAITVAAWIMHGGSPGGYRYILAKGAAACVAASYGLYTGPNGGLEFYISRDQGAIYARSPDAGTGVWDGNWHFVVGTFDGTTIRLYVDGVEVGSGTAYPGRLEYPLATSNDLFIGDYPGCQNRTFVGNIDEVTIWNQALTAADVRLLIPADSNPSGSGGSPNSGSGSVGGGGHGGSRVAGGRGQSGQSGRGIPALRMLRLTPSRFAVAAAGRGGSAITYVDSRAARSLFKVLLRQSSIRGAQGCITVFRRCPPTGARARARDTLVGEFMHADRKGANRFRFAGRIGRRRLKPGAYLLCATPTMGNKTGRTASIAFQIIR